MLKIHCHQFLQTYCIIDPGIEDIPSPYLFKSSKIECLLMRFTDFNPLFLSCLEISYLARPLEPIEIKKCVDLLINSDSSFLILQIGDLF